MNRNKQKQNYISNTQIDSVYNRIPKVRKSLTKEQETLFNLNGKPFALNLMLTFLHTIVKIGGLEEARRYKNMDHMIVDHVLATVRELMFCT